MWKLRKCVKLLEHDMKAIKRIFKKHLKNMIEIDEMQMGFMSGKGTINVIFVLGQMLKKYEKAGELWKNMKDEKNHHTLFHKIFFAVCLPTIIN